MAQSRDTTFWSRVGVTLLVLGVYYLGTNVPLPGLDSEKVSVFLGSVGPAAAARLSIFSLGIMPLLNALILLEILKLVAPAVRAWETASWRNHERMGHVAVGLALVMALVQGGGIASGLEQATGLVQEPGPQFRAVCIATLIAGSALTIAFATIIDRAGLGSGLWLLFLLPSLAELPGTIIALTMLNASGTYATNAVILGAAFSAIAIAAVVSIVLAARAAAPTVATCIWTPFVANAVLTPALFTVGLLATFSVDGALAVASPKHLAWYLALTIVVALVVWLYLRSYEGASESSPVPAAPIAATLAAILAGGAILETQMGVVLALGTAPMIVAAAVATTTLIQWGFVKERPQAEAIETDQPTESEE